MRKFISALLLIILFVSIFLNVSMLYQDYKSTPNNGDIKGSYELFMVDIRAAQTSLNTYFEETDEKKKQLALYDLLSSTYKMDSDLKLLDVKSKLLYKRGLSPLQSFTSDFVIISSRLFTSYTMEGKDITGDAKKYKSYIDDLNNVLKDTTMQDKKSTKKVFDKVDNYSRNHTPIY
ncbi:hypothetical protein SAMN04488601_1011570 [Paenibacillus sp. 453mf]|nr:hypothetical protein SAMN04488601_1011570 [Paenibacillus sp. 453mf]